MRGKKEKRGGSRYTNSEVQALRGRLCSWFTDNQRDLPWRKAYDPYQVWISEIMGQQTQMDRVVLYFNRWIKQFPDVTAVAKASEQEILKAWEGLGYYSRARNILAAAKLISKRHQGRIPADPDLLLALPGIGPYTAAAIASIAYDKPCPLLDANVKRLFARLLDLDIPVKQTPAPKILQKFAERLLPRDNGRFFNQALMEFGALVCRPVNPDCPSCPLAGHCRSRQRGMVSQRPVPGKKIKKIEIVMACGIILHNGLYYIQQRHADDVWGSLWEFPGGRLKEGETPEQAACREVLEETEFSVFRLRPLATVVHHYTKYRVTLHGFTCLLQKSGSKPVLHAACRHAWVPFSGLSDFPFPAGHRKLLAALSEQTRQKNMKK